MGICVPTADDLVPVCGCLIVGINVLAGRKLSSYFLVFFSQVLEPDYCDIDYSLESLAGVLFTASM